MTPYDMIRDQLGKAVPFANHVGVELVEVGDGTGVAALDQRPETSNHIQTQHAGAMFTLGEAASGAALAGAFGPMIFQARPVASGASISYVKIAKGRLEAHAQTERPGPELVKELQEVGKTAFDINVDIRDGDGDTVVTMTVGWHVRKA
ncbi:DUF4442 domain-containing protein [Tateyamaria omphalii]|uniref:PaaI family thioesterase n=1 Tax=Tateyamaria omphalii TaxID=299262 RepID=UPI00167B46A8|nr:DUF4442 domain-containing protein [Tateyamaria omphalii]GGX46041.1 DUF4442 domain-containing protein [Tateyamaria omphalii]